MITVELSRLVADEPLIGEGPRRRANTQPTALTVGEWGIERIVYVPGLALCVVGYHDTTAMIVPVEHVWSMYTAGRESTLSKLAEALR